MHVVERTYARLVILDPPFYAAGMAFLAAGLAIGLLSFLRVESDGVREPLGWVALVFAAPFLLLGLGQLTSSSTAILSRASGTLTIARKYFGVTLVRREVPLQNLKGAGVGTNEQAHSLQFVLASGEEISLSTASTRKGYYQAADEVNEFLSASRVTLPSR